MARTGESKQTIRDAIAERFGYDMYRTLDGIRPTYRFDVSCQGSVPESIIAFLDSWSYEVAIKNAISLGGDADTMACIAGGIAQAYYREVPKWIVERVSEKLPRDLMEVGEQFNGKYSIEWIK